MSMIRVENLTFSYPSSSDNIFENVNLQKRKRKNYIFEASSGKVSI